MSHYIVAQIQKQAKEGTTPSGSILQRKCDKCRKKRYLQRRSSVQAKPTEALAIPPMVHEVLRSPGQPLDTATRSFFEPRFGHDFSQVRVHSDAKAANSARAVNALAYTTGKNIVFGGGRYSPETSEGQKLLAHELTHVVQQSGTSARAKLVLGQGDDHYEREADRLAEDLISAKSAQKLPLPVGRDISSIQRQIESENGPEFLSEDMTAEETEVEDGDSPPGATVEVGEFSDAQLESLEEPEDSLMIQSQSAIQFQKEKDKPKAPPPKPAPPTITQIDVDLSSQKMKITWSDGTTNEGIPVSTGKGVPNTKEDPCKERISENCTPTGSFKPGKKGGADYTNKKGDAMSYYVEFQGEGVDDRGIGIHNSQSVTGQPASHGCIRVDETTAKRVNKNVTKSTEIVVSGKAPTKPWTKPKPAPKKKPAKKK